MVAIFVEKRGRRPRTALTLSALLELEPAQSCRIVVRLIRLGDCAGGVHADGELALLRCDVEATIRNRDDQRGACASRNGRRIEVRWSRAVEDNAGL